MNASSNVNQILVDSASSYVVENQLFDALKTLEQ